MLTYGASMDPIPDRIELDLECMEVSENSQNWSNYAEIVLDIARQAVAVDDPSEFLRKVAEMLQRSNNYGLVQLWALDPNHDRLSLSGYSFNVLLDLFANRTIPALTEECRRDGAAPEIEILAEKKTGSAPATTFQRLITPLCLHAKVFGLLSIEDNRPDAFSAEHRDTVNSVASIINAAFDRFKAIAEARRSNEYLRGVMNTATDLAILATDQRGYVVTSSSGSETIFQLPLQSILGRDIIAIFTDERFQQELMIAINSCEGNSIAIKNNRLKQATKNGTIFLDVSFQKLCSDSSQIGFLCFVKDVTENAIYQQKMEATARIENITGFFNRRHMMNALSFEIERCRLFNRSFSLCLMRLNNFKIYNDSQGSLNSDETIKAVADLMRTLIRTNVDTCYRYGDDEFAIIMPETSTQDAARMSERILNQLRDTFDGAITARIGIAEYSPALKAENILDQAVQTMHQTRTSGGDYMLLVE
jgi:diguanylate cyclase (GGDEF)-like protein